MKMAHLWCNTMRLKKYKHAKLLTKGLTFKTLLNN